MYICRNHQRQHIRSRLQGFYQGEVVSNYSYNICRAEYTILTPEGKLEIWTSLQLQGKWLDIVKLSDYAEGGIYWADLMIDDFLGVTK